MKNKLLILISGILIIILTTGCTNQKANVAPNDEQIEKEIMTNLEQITEVTDLTSSNPFDYTKNEYYNNIINLGDDAAIVLENMYNEGKLTGVNAYLSALAIQDITKCNLYEKYNIDWSNAEEFFSYWKENNCSFKK